MLGKIICYNSPRWLSPSAQLDMMNSHISYQPSDQWSTFGEACKDQNELIMLIHRALSLSGGFELADLFPSRTFLHGISGMESKLVETRKKVDVVLDNIITVHRENRANGKNCNGESETEDLIDVLENRENGKNCNGESETEDLIDVFLRVMENGEFQFSLTDDNIKAVILDMFVAGSDTSSSTAIWLKKETKIDGFTIPLKSKVLVNVWAIGRDPESWENPECFMPERFENSSIEFTGNHFQLLPFGAGRRICPGMQFGMALVTLPLAHLLYKFDWKLPEGINASDLDMTESNGITARKENDLYLIATPA
ncbi:hypothetical protein P3S67_030045 [Capsicum chacoense]